VEPASIRVPGADGLTLHALVWSDQGTPMVFLHGFGNDAHVWDEICPAFAPHYRTLAFDLRGHGSSDWDTEMRYDHASMARDFEVAFEALGLQRLVLVGHSMGGRVAMRLAGQMPEKLAGLAIVDSGPEVDARGVTRIRLEASQGPLRFSSLGQYERLLGELYPAVRAETLARLAAHWTYRTEDGSYELKLDPRLRGGGRDLELDPEELREIMARETRQLWDALEALPCPALVVRGAASDILAPETADRMVDEAIPDARLAVIPRASHSVMLDNPEGFLQALSDFALG
jgi:pimeloyl-ACP methyl ester carboxylesterase